MTRGYTPTHLAWLAASCLLLAISLLGMFTDQEKEPQMRAGSTSTATPLNGNGRP